MCIDNAITDGGAADFLAQLGKVGCLFIGLPVGNLPSKSSFSLSSSCPFSFHCFWCIAFSSYLLEPGQSTAPTLKVDESSKKKRHSSGNSKHTKKKDKNSAKEKEKEEEEEEDGDEEVKDEKQWPLPCCRVRKKTRSSWGHCRLVYGAWCSQLNTDEIESREGESNKIETKGKCSGKTKEIWGH